ncbi:MAG: aminopeptidase P family protein [Candidatus Spechtbacteria bacterium]|nr:aminopeptidase P family protein [Candidatus Spechtbacteria bacterium]
MEADVYLGRLAKVREAMVRHEVDALVLSKDQKVHSVDALYISGFTGSTAVLVITRENAAFITDSRYTEQARQEVYGFEILETKMQHQIFDEFIPGALGSAARVGFMRKEVLFEFYHLIKEELPHLTLVGLPSLIESIRQVKDSEEMRRIIASVRATEQAIRHAISCIQPGISELDIAEAFRSALPKGSTLAFDSIVASGERSILAHGLASEKIIERGDVIQLDVGCMLHGYASDLSRVAVCGKASAEQKRMHLALVKAIDGGLEFYRPGCETTEAYKCALGVLDSQGYGDEKFGHALGNGIGLAVHEDPAFGPRPPGTPQDILEVGHVATIEPGIYSKKLGFGMRIELDVGITPNGHKILDRLPWRQLVETDKL